MSRTAAPAYGTGAFLLGELAVQMSGIQSPIIGAVLWAGAMVCGFLAIVRSDWFLKLAKRFGKHPMALTIVLFGGAIVGSGSFFVAWLFAGSPGKAAALETSAAAVPSEPSSTQQIIKSLDEIKTLLSPIENAEYRGIVAEILHKCDPQAKISVDGAVTGPDGERHVDIQLWSQYENGPTLTAIDVVDRPDGKPVGIEIIDAADSKRRDIRADTMLVCSDTGFDPAALRKAKRVNIGLISVLREGDDRIKAEIVEEYYYRSVKFASTTIEIQGTINMTKDEANNIEVRLHDYKYHGKSVDAWAINKIKEFVDGVKTSSNIELLFHFKEPLNFDFGEHQTITPSISVRSMVEITWFYQTVRLDASSGIYDYIQDRIQLPNHGERSLVMKGFSLDSGIPMEGEPPPRDAPPSDLAMSITLIDGLPSVAGIEAAELDDMVRPVDLEKYYSKPIRGEGVSTIQAD